MLRELKNGMSEDHQEVREEQILEPYGDEEALEFYRHILVTALENNENVKEFCIYNSAEDIKAPVGECDILVEKSTEDIDNISMNLDMSVNRRVCLISNDDIDFVFDHINEWKEEYETGLLITVSLVPDGKLMFNDQINWHPVHPCEIVNDTEHNTIYEALSYLFGGDPDDYKVEDNNWIQRCNEQLELSDDPIEREYTA